MVDYYVTTLEVPVFYYFFENGSFPFAHFIFP